MYRAGGGQLQSQNGSTGLESGGALVHRRDGRLLHNFLNTGGDTSAAADGQPVRHVRVACPGKVAGGCEFFNLDEGIFLLALDHAMPRSMRSPVVGEDLVEFHYRLRGALSLQGGWGKVDISKPAFLLWYQSSGFDDVSEFFDANTGWELSFSVFCSRDWLRRNLLAGQGEECGTIAEILDGGIEGLKYKILPPPPRAAQALEQLVRNPYAGPARVLFAKSKALELICASLMQLDHAQQFAPRPARRDSSREAVEQVEQVLRHQMASPPSLRAIARLVGCAPARLSREFKECTGETMREFLHRVRLDRARKLLLTTNLQIKQIAGSVGYAHHSTFTTAFADRFGVTPKAMMAERAEEDISAGATR